MAKDKVPVTCTEHEPRGYKMTNIELFEQKIRALQSDTPGQSELIGKIKQTLLDQDDWSLWRINPFRFAQRHQLDPEETLNLFVRLARAGLFSFGWNTICPYCGGSHSYDSLNYMDSHSFYCSLCHRHIPTNLDDYIEVSFTVEPSIRSLEQVAPFTNQQNFFRYYFSENVRWSAELQQYGQQAFRAFNVCAPGQTLAMSITAEPGQLYRLISLSANTVHFIRVTEAPVQDTVNFIQITPTDFATQEIQVSPGQVTLEITNLRPEPVGMLLVLTNFEQLNTILANHPSIFRPHLSAKQLLNNQAFRELYPIQNLIPDLHLNVRSLTILFTDLKGSTALYDTVGDVGAYNLIRQHFGILFEAVRQNSGAVIKTMGDAIMATFSEPLDGVQAAVTMLQRLAGVEGRPLGLKVGLHEGPALVINADSRLDYFGQSVNIAARVQALAESDQICISETVFLSPPVRRYIEQLNSDIHRFEANLKGVGESKVVYRVRPVP
jgi:class 3 adenylate cyclase